MRSASREPEQAQLYPRFIIGISDKIVIRHQTSFTEEMGRVDHWRNVSRKSAQSRKYANHFHERRYLRVTYDTYQSQNRAHVNKM